MTMEHSDAEHTPLPPNVNRIPVTLEYLPHFMLDTAHIAPQGQAESSKVYKRRIHNTVLNLLSATTGSP
jgi:hypothetical protein